jgi:hypothetical protein
MDFEQDKLSSAALVRSGWTLSFQHFYNHKTTVAELDAVGGTKWIVAARRKGKDTLVVAAMGDKAAVLKRTTNSDVADEHNGAYWYCSEVSGAQSFGFAPVAKVSLCQADAHDKASPHRLSWHIHGNNGGWRAGSNYAIHISTAWEMLIFTA